MIVYGRNAVREAIRGPRAVRRAWATKNAAREEWLEGAGLRIEIASAAEIALRSGSEGHQGVCAELEPFRYVAAEQLLEVDAPLIVALDQVQDPQNLGAICRSAECAGATGIVIPVRRSAAVTGAVCKASAGAVEHLPLARVRNLADFLAAAKAAGAWVYGADPAGSLDYRMPDYRGAIVIVLGSEGRGLRRRVASSCDALLAIPVRGVTESLSVSAAAAVLLYAVAKDHGAGPEGHEARAS